MANTQNSEIKLPKAYQIDIFPESVELLIPDFEPPPPLRVGRALALRKRNCREWYDEFIDKIVAACGNEFLPVCRMSDGEFLFLLGEQPIDKRIPFLPRLKLFISRLKQNFLSRGEISALTQGHYHSGQYSAEEWRQARSELPEAVRALSKKGVIAWHLDFTDKPFAECYFPALSEWMKKNNITVNDNNYYPFYFVYAMLTDSRRGELFKNRRVLVVNGAQGETKQKIIDGLKREGVSEVYWCAISSMRSLYDTIDIAPFIGKVDFAVVGAGIGKANIMLQMEALNVPCIDAGFIFEVWKDPQNRGARPYTVCNSDLEKEQ
ncbi:MAG: hypothetical protein WCS27_10775 [Victivallaceae bacterium]